MLAVLLGWLGLAGAAAGLLLWPAFVLHAAVTALLARDIARLS